MPMMHQHTWVTVSMCFVLSELHNVLAGLERTCTPFTKRFGPHPRGMCGSQIDETLSLWCLGSYNGAPSYIRKKRENPREGHLRELGGILIPRKEANSYLVKRSDWYERGIVCECCYNRCSILELTQYCTSSVSMASMLGLMIKK